MRPNKTLQLTPSRDALLLYERFVIPLSVLQPQPVIGAAELGVRHIMTILEMTPAHYDAVIELLHRIPGIGMRDADSREGIMRYLQRNPGLSFVAFDNSMLIGCAMCGHDGRRGYLQHVAVDHAFRGNGIAHELVSSCLNELKRIGIFKVHIDVFKTNDLANSYWSKRGWKLREDIYRYSLVLSDSNNA